MQHQARNAMAGRAEPRAADLHIALDGGHDDDARILTLAPARLLLGFLDVGQQVGHSLLHDTSALDDLHRNSSASVRQFAHVPLLARLQSRLPWLCADVSIMLT